MKEFDDRQQAQEIARLVQEHNSHGTKPRVHGEDLLVMAADPQTLTDFIGTYTVLNRPVDMQRLLRWRLDVRRENGVPLSAIAPSEARGIYNAIFDQRALLESEETPIEIVLFRRGQSGRELTSLLQVIPNAIIRIIVSGTDDGGSWTAGARAFQAPGVPGAGKALEDLAGCHKARELCAWRFGRRESVEGHNQLSALGHRLLAPAANVELSDEMRVVHQLAMKLNAEARKQLGRWVHQFVDHWSECGQGFSLDDIPFRSVILVGAAIEHNFEWQTAIDRVAEFLKIAKNHEVILPTVARYHLLALRSDGVIYVSETSLNKYGYDPANPFAGLWLVEAERFRTIQGTVEETLHSTGIESRPWRHPNSTRGEDEYDPATIKIDAVRVADASRELSRLFRSREKPIELQKRATTAIAKAHIILISSRQLETNVAGAIITPGMGDAIRNNEKALKINLSEVDPVDDPGQPQDQLDRLYRYLSGVMEQSSVQPGCEPICHFVNYLLVGVVLRSKLKSRRSLVQTEAASEYAVNAVSVFARESKKYAFYKSLVLHDAILALYGLHKHGFAISGHDGLMKHSHSTLHTRENREAEPGLFRAKLAVIDLVARIRSRLVDIAATGAFLFDVDMTILPSGAKSLTQFPSLAYLFMRLLREGIRVAIVSGNSFEEQSERLLRPIQAQMHGELSALSNLTFYVNGGATKYTFKDDQCIADDEYNLQHSVQISDLRSRVNRVLRQAAKSKFGLESHQLDTFIKMIGDKRAADGTKISPWAKAGAWTPKWVSSINAQEPDLACPFVEVRGALKDPASGAKRCASVTIKPIPKLADDLDPRTELCTKLQKSLRDSFGIRSGGATSIDITHNNANKKQALFDYLNQVSERSRVYYFGDEFYERNGQRGNDEVVAQEPKLSKIHTLAVNKDDMHGADKKTIWIGRTPQAILEFLEAVLIRRDEYARDPQPR